LTIYGSTASLSDYYRLHAHLYDGTRWAFLFGRDKLIRVAAERLRPRRILEIGCGTGRNLAQLASSFPEAEIVGVDLSPDMLNKARRKVAGFGSRVTLREGAYVAPLSTNGGFDLIVCSYTLTMINPGFADILRCCQADLSATGSLAVVDFHDTRFGWFRRWMGLNHVRFDGQILAALRETGMRMEPCTVKAAYGGLWRWMLCLAHNKS
jgi:S-adenosylmethionine-diacylgycerolhomoserine-N-methlytransferase